MYGLVFVVFEAFVLQTFGTQRWHGIKLQANCSIPDAGFISKEYYEDKLLVDLTVAACQILSLSIESALEAFGAYFTTYLYNNGYDGLLRSNGRTLRQWLSNLNGMHEYLGKKFPKAEYQPPVFWCEDDDNNCGSILLHYYSLRGPLFTPFVKGVIQEVARYQFDSSSIMMDQIKTQGQDGSELTTWRISVTDPEKQWILLDKKFEKSPLAENEGKSITQNADDSIRCPFSGHIFSVSDYRISTFEKDKHQTCPFVNNSSFLPVKEDVIVASDNEQIDKSPLRLMTLFPYHILVNKDFVIEHVGDALADSIKSKNDSLIGMHIGHFFEISRPVVGCQWSFNSLKKLFDQKFYMVMKSSLTSRKEKVLRQGDDIKFSSSIFEIDNRRLLFLLSPDARNVDELKAMGLTLADLPLHGSQRDVVLLGEYIAQEANKSDQLERLSKALENEKNLSNTLLYNMLPKEIADDLRQKKRVQAKHYKNVTIFFSDIEGFTSICDRLHPREVIDMLNKLYSVMDYLASQFGLYKVETVGDAYMCCSGVPNPDENHAENIANFALAVRHCVKHILSPVDGKSINLRIGIHTGDCTAGVVGTLTPHFCLFGDMVNVASRLESTSLAGKIQCSEAFYWRLRNRSPRLEQYVFASRGKIQIKGKGPCHTYWLEEVSKENSFLNASGLDILSNNVQHLLQKEEWKVNHFFDSYENNTLFENSPTEVPTNSILANDTISNQPNRIDDFPNNKDTLDRNGNSFLDCDLNMKRKPHRFETLNTKSLYVGMIMILIVLRLFLDIYGCVYYEFTIGYQLMLLLSTALIGFIIIQIKS